MKKLLLAAGILALVGGGLWWLARRPARTGTLDTHQEAFRLEPLGQGTMVTFDNPALPLRAFRWLPPDATGTVFVQIVTQTDRQDLAWFSEGRLGGHLTVPKPEGVHEGSYRLMELVEAHQLPDQTALLAFRPPNVSDAFELILIDQASGALRWHAQAPGERLALAVDAKGMPQAVCLYGGSRPLLSLPLALGKGERVDKPRALPEGLPLPPELPQASAMIAQGKTLLVAGPTGLAAHHEGAWTFEPAPAPSPLGFAEPRPRLAVAGQRLFWQPEPGQLVEVSPQGKPLRTLSLSALPLLGSPQEKDASLLQLLGADRQGALWFSLATPLLPKAPAPPPAAKEEGWTAEAPPTTEPAPGTAVDRTEWEAYLAQDRGRIYRFHPDRGDLERMTWGEAWPSLRAGDFPAPVAASRLKPAGGWLLSETGQRAWLAPLSVLPWRKVEPVKAPGTP